MVGPREFLGRLEMTVRSKTKNKIFVVKVTEYKNPNPSCILSLYGIFNFDQL